MSIKEHFSRMLITIGWAATAGVIIYGTYCLCSFMSLMGDQMNREEALSQKIKKFMMESGWDSLSEEELMDEVSKQLDTMVELGQVKRLVGEDGKFYYRSTGIFPFSTKRHD